jgi:hypothetical protein
MSTPYEFGAVYFLTKAIDQKIIFGVVQNNLLASHGKYPISYGATPKFHPD